jgi:hypothetical protein
VIVDFGADVSFKEVQKKIIEHYRIELPVGAIQTITENHAKNILEFLENDKFEEGKAQQIIVEMDGSMIPVVDTAILKEGKADKRKCRTTRWQEARLCFSRGAQQLSPIFYATMGTVERAGDLLYRAALRTGFGSKTKVHGLGDGATWIAEQMNRVFGNQVKFLVDFYHTSEYLAAAAEHGWSSNKIAWRKEQEELLKQSKYQKVLEVIRCRLPVDWDTKQEAKKAQKKSKIKQEKKEEETPLEKCYRYISNRQNQLDYKEALDKGLPIGSGEIESGNKHVIQKRLKIAGAWWKPEIAEHMLCLRTLRVNNDWDRYWHSRLAAA